jgi:transposase
MSAIAFSTRHKFFASLVFEGYCNRGVVVEFFKKVLIPKLKKGMVLVMDRASYHFGFELEQLVCSAGCRILYLPAYSPDFNPIEKLWSPLKYMIRKLLSKGKSLKDSMIDAINHYGQS